MKRTRTKSTAIAKRQRTGTKSNPIVISDAQVARALNRRTGGFLAIEKKFVDLFFSGAIATSLTGAEADPTALCLNAIVQGDGESQRDGRQVILNSVQVKGFVEIPAGTVNTDRVVEVYVVMDTQTNGAQLNSEDVLVDAAGGSQAVNCFHNLQYSKRFKVLKHQRFDMPGYSAWNGTSFAQVTSAFDWYIKLPNVKVNFTGTTGTVSTIADNSIHVIAVSSQSANLRYSSRVRFQG